MASEDETPETAVKLVEAHGGVVAVKAALQTWDEVREAFDVRFSDDPLRLLDLADWLDERGGQEEIERICAAWHELCTRLSLPPHTDTEEVLQALAPSPSVAPPGPTLKRVRSAPAS